MQVVLVPLLYIISLVFTLLGFIGSIVGIKNAVRQKKAAKVASDSSSGGTSSDSLQPLKAKMLQKSEDAVVRFENAEGESQELGLIDAVYFKENGSMQLYAILQQREGEWQLRVAQYHEESDTLSLIDGETAERVLAEWQKGAATPQKNGAVQRAGGRLKLDLYDTIVYRSDWKAFRKRASQDELFALAVGSRYQLDGVKFYIRSLLGAVGGVLSIVLAFVLAEDFSWFAVMGGVVGYCFFNLLASKQLGYADTLSECRRKLNRENRQLLKELFPDNILVIILRQLVLMLLTIVTIPYKFILMIIETFIPAARNWTVAHGGNAGAVISMPKGCDIGGLAAMGEYYASQKLGDAVEQSLEEREAARVAKYQKYTYTDKYGVRQEAYSDDGRAFYSGTDRLKEVGTSEDGGKTIKLK